ncbi:MAG: hypothetical protein QNJ47_07590 [Nostocaceae cyanobacterium]|nr:hypothetical protein [Nostocaceae cyanobacterium]
MTQMIIASDLASIGAIKSGSNRLTLNGVSYSRGISFSQRVQDAAEKICKEYQQQNIKCLLVREGLVLTLWLSQPSECVINQTQTPTLPPKVVPPPAKSEMVFEGFGEETIVELPSASEPQSQSDYTHSDDINQEKIMSYRGNTYKVSIDEQASLSTKPETVKKRMYRGRAY